MFVSFVLVVVRLCVPLWSREGSVGRDQGSLGDRHHQVPGPSVLRRRCVYMSATIHKSNRSRARYSITGSDGYRRRKQDGRYVFVKYRPLESMNSYTYDMFTVFSGFPENRIPVFLFSAFLGIPRNQMTVRL